MRWPGSPREHELVISHGNGPQVGLLALQGAAYKDVDAYPLDVLGAETQGMIGYLVEQELGNLLPFDRPLATLLTMVEVDPDDPAFADPTKFVGPIYDEASAKRSPPRRVGSSSPTGHTGAASCPRRGRSGSSRSGRCAGCSIRAPSSSAPAAAASRRCTRGTPTAQLVGVEAVIDKDLASSLLARELGADLFVMATDVDAVYRDWGKPTQARIDRATPAELDAMDLPAGSMGPKVDAATEFATATGKRAAIGSLEDIDGLVDGSGGTQVVGRSGPR